MLARAQAEGHWIGNHSWTHSVPLGYREEPDIVEAEIVRTQRLIGAYADRTKLFRPFGGGGNLDRRLLDPTVVDHLRAEGYTCADDEAYEKNRAVMQDVGGSLHTAFKVSQKIFDEVKARCEKHGVTPRIVDHGYCTSIYIKTPDEMKLEFTVDVPEYGQIAEMRRKDAHSELARWMAGDRHTNNTDRH